ncbi:MAG: hypothetical protein M5U01_28875 [Ardenticatenaceae bacterium]|nr:hypothetical protein [Ardenticatenaceae bacterium]HBY92545.1 hypothetical protein [Chloroflexota bacterium]
MRRLTGHDLWTVYRLQRRGVRLDLKGSVIRPAAPLALAFASLLPVWGQRVETVVLRRKERGKREAGFVQARWRTGQPVLDVTFIAPSLDVQHGAAWLWQSMLQELVRGGGEQGAQRIFTHLPESRPAEVEVMRQAGFALYGQDRLYRFTPPAAGESSGSKGMPVHWQAQRPEDEWGLQKLYTEITPAVVQQAENWGQVGNGSTTHVGWWGGPRRGSYVLRAEDEIYGYLRITPGERGHWLKLVLHPEISQDGETLLKEAMIFFTNLPRRPIFCDVRGYEGYLTDGLERCGFRRVMTRLLLVRHTTVPIREPARRLIPAFEVETAPTVSTSRGEAFGHWFEETPGCLR